MKLQYLGDSKDSFKWDYHDWLASEMKFSRLTVALMLTPDDGGAHGNTKADQFPARTPVLRFCGELRARRDINFITQLPSFTGGSYDVALHKSDKNPLARTQYFSGFAGGLDQVVFIDPDNGFEPEKSCDQAHVAYRDLEQVLAQLADNSIVSVFQIHRRVPFPEDLARIRKRLGSARSTAVYWHSLMFVAVGRSEKTIEAVIEANRKYARNRPVKVIP